MVVKERRKIWNKYKIDIYMSRMIIWTQLLKINENVRLIDRLIGWLIDWSIDWWINV